MTTLVHLLAEDPIYGPVPLCGRAMWDDLTEDRFLNECWECASIVGAPWPQEGT